MAADFDLIEWIAHFESQRKPVFDFASLVYAQIMSYRTLYDFHTTGPYDIQRMPDVEGIKDGEGFVEAFVGAASFVYGVAGCVLGADIYTLVIGGGAQNILNSLNNPDVRLSGAWGNNIRNVRNMRLGYFFAQDPDKYCEKQDEYICEVFNTEPKGLLDPLYQAYLNYRK